MPFSDLDRAAVARTLGQIAQQPDDRVDAFFERTEIVELPPEGGPPGLVVRREQGFAVRLVREHRTWLASRDELEPRAFSEALRQVARVLPSAAYPEPRLAVGGWPEVVPGDDLLTFPVRLERAIRERRVAFPCRLTVARHRRWLQVVGLGPAPEAQQEELWSLRAELPWGSWGSLCTGLGESMVERTADLLVDFFRARNAPAVEDGPATVVLAPAAAAVLIHEAAHALEADVLARGGDPEAAVGVEMGGEDLSLLDDPGTAPPRVRRTSDDEGLPVQRRWLLRQGRVAQPLADGQWAAESTVLSPGAGRRGHRHAPPTPRSTHLELLAGDVPTGELTAGAEDGLWIPEARRGTLDPITGALTLEAPFARRIRRGTPAEPLGPCRLVGTVAEIFEAVAALGRETVTAGAGWCAKGGSKLPVWATVPALRLEGVRVEGTVRDEAPVEAPFPDDGEGLP